MTRLLPTALVLCTVVAAGCGGGKKTASCDARATTLDDGSRICIDYRTSDLSLPQSACQLMGGGWSVGASCGALGDSLGGCELKGGAMWFFASKRHKTGDDVRAQCESMSGAETGLGYLEPTP